jgi:hypothetical protein
MKRPVLTSLVFVIGCAAGGVASQVVIPPARAGTSPTRWEYLCTNVKQSVPEALAESGSKGWEMVSAFPSHYEQGTGAGLLNDLKADAYGFCFKRALP